MGSLSDRAKAVISSINESIKEDEYGWRVDAVRGVYRRDEDKSKSKTGHGKDEDGKATTTIACHNAVVPIGIYENIDSRKRKIELAYIDTNTKKWRSVLVDMSMVMSAGQVTKLADDGIMVDSNISKNFVSYLSRILSDKGTVITRFNSKSVMGWIDNKAFVPYADDIVMDNSTEQRQLFDCYDSRGSIDEWSRYVLPLRKNIILRLAMAASFASPLVELTGQNSFVYHMFGGTGSGKTVALMVAASIWGNPDQGKLVRTLNMTKNSMLSMAAFLRNLPMFGDELQTIKTSFNNSYDSIIMCLTEGIERGRLNANSEMRETRAWKCSFIFTGEENCVKPSSGGGAKNRVIAAECTGKIVENGMDTANYLRKHYGTAGRKFITAVADGVNDLYAQHFCDIISQKTVSTTDKQAGAMALIMTADDIASDLFWQGKEKKLTIEDVRPYLCSSAEVDAAERAFQFLVSAIARNTANFCYSSGTSQVNAGGREVWGKLIGLQYDPDSVLINQSVVEDLLARQGFDYDSCKKSWVRQGYLVLDGKRYSTRTSINGAKTNYIRLNLKGVDGNGQANEQ